MPESDGGPPARRGGRLRGRRQQRHGHLLPLHPCMAGVRLIGVEAAARGWTAASTAASHQRGGPACCTATAPTCCRTTTARSSRRIGVARAWTTRRGPRACLAARHRPRRIRGHHRRRGAGGLSPPVPRRRHHPGAGVEHAFAYAMKLAPTMRTDQPSRSTCRAAATRTSARSLPTGRAFRHERSQGRAQTNGCTGVWPI